MEWNILFPLWLATMITINLGLRVIKTLFSEGAIRRILPLGDKIYLSQNYSNTHRPYVKLWQYCNGFLPLVNVALDVWFHPKMWYPSYEKCISPTHKIHCCHKSKTHFWGKSSISKHLLSKQQHIRDEKYGKCKEPLEMNLFHLKCWKNTI